MRKLVAKHCYSCGETAGQWNWKRSTNCQTVAEVVETIPDNNHPRYSGNGGVLVNVRAVVVMMMVMIVSILLIVTAVSSIASRFCGDGIRFRGDLVRVLITLVWANLIDIVMGLVFAVSTTGREVVIAVNVGMDARLALQCSYKLRVAKTVFASLLNTVARMAMMTMSTRLPQRHFFLGGLGACARTLLFPRLQKNQFTRCCFTAFWDISAGLRKVCAVAANTSLNSSEPWTNHFLILCGFFLLLRTNKRKKLTSTVFATKYK